ncbi:diaminopropionate ammonia-lyase [Streptomyces kanamyceticus]|uniref:Diaminopropionate ammonia-lyase n=1 Tax=Streptomyces kanamyceticus TaxID=1967 RepID=A0A5J6GMQ0_STRKN|nr:diaminopropionate ammonia-lyase [Streptomyces kanamyceticus]QEU96527.1 diaminopropionate ammonia-lyase [Streptomyces kanamyceticus]
MDQETDSQAGSAPPLPWYARPAARSWTCAPAPSDARDFHASLPGYARTPLHELPALAGGLRVGRVFVKDESERLGLPAFKALGASWAIHQVLARRPNGGSTDAAAHPLNLIAATDGNHGRAVARMARHLGQRAHVFVPDGVHAVAVDAIRGEGAEVTEVAGSYDVAVRRAADAAAAPDAVLIQDTAWDGYEEIPSLIVEGYSTLFTEIDAQLAENGVESPSLVAVPVGVGALAQAAVTHYRGRPAGGAAPALLAVEPEAAACALASLRAGRLTSVPTGVTAMAGLNCGTPSSLGWPALRDGLDAAVAVTDAASAAAVRDLADLGVSSGPCGAAPLAGVRAALTGPGAAERRAALGISPSATVVLLSTEGAAANPHLREESAKEPVQR